MWAQRLPEPTSQPLPGAARRTPHKKPFRFSRRAGLKSLPSPPEFAFPIEVEMLDVKRTLVEKLFTVHAAYAQDRAANKTRHYYDLFRLCSLPEIRDFAGTDEYREIFRSVRQYSQENFPVNRLRGSTCAPCRAKLM